MQFSNNPANAHNAQSQQGWGGQEEWEKPGDAEDRKKNINIKFH